MNEIQITASDLLAYNPSDIPKYAKDFSTSTFWHYTRLTSADLILSSGSFRVSNLNGMNDLDELELHSVERDKVFVLCFCNSNSEKIPMWYLYSGLAGNGASLGLTPSIMLKWLRTINTVIGVRNGQKKDKGKRLEIGRDVELRFGWVYYRKTQEPTHIMYRNKWYCVDDEAKIRKDNYFLKVYPWEYEKEFRLVIINRTRESYDAVFMEIPPEIKDTIKVRLAPEIREDKLNGIAGLKCIGSALSHKPAYSSLSICMNLLHRNRDSLLDYIQEELTKADSTIDADRLCTAIQSAKRCNRA